MNKVAQGLCGAMVAVVAFSGCAAAPTEVAATTPPASPAAVGHMTAAEVAACTPKRGEPDWDAFELCKKLLSD